MTIDELIVAVKEARAKADAHECDYSETLCPNCPEAEYEALAANNAPLLAECLEIALKALPLLTTTWVLDDNLKRVFPARDALSDIEAKVRDPR